MSRQGFQGGDSPPEPQDREISDLVGAELTLALMGWLIVTLVCFFFIGPVVGLILVLAGLIGFGWWAVSALRRADTSD
ncbi:MAG: hypothetical protein U0R26_09995 [Solirubrobacterales bacterium]